jgi:hypothetical protein
VLVGTWPAIRQDPTAAGIENGPQSSGVFADFLPTSGGVRLAGLSRAGVAARRFGPDAGLVAATRRFDGPPVWVLTGVTPAGVRAAAEGLSAAALRDDYAVAFERGEAIPLPVR